MAQTYKERIYKSFHCKPSSQPNLKRLCLRLPTLLGILLDRHLLLLLLDQAGWKVSLPLAWPISGSKVGQQAFKQGKGLCLGMLQPKLRKPEMATRVIILILATLFQKLLSTLTALQACNGGQRM